MWGYLLFSFKDMHPSCSLNVIISNKSVLFRPKQPSQECLHERQKNLKMIINIQTDSKRKIISSEMVFRENALINGSRAAGW